VKSADTLIGAGGCILIVMLAACGDHAVRPMAPQLDPASRHGSEAPYAAPGNPLDGALPEGEAADESASEHHGHHHHHHEGGGAP